MKLFKNTKDNLKGSPQNVNRITAFYQILANTLVVSVINFTVWFAITFFVYLETRSVFATAIIAGIYLVLTALSGFWFGSLVDHYKKKHVMLFSSFASLLLYGVSFWMYLSAGPEAFKDPTSPLLWLFVNVLMIGVIVGNIRTIALPTLVTILIPEEKRDKANGLAGTASGISFLLTSVISGLLVGIGGMLYVFVLAIIATLAATAHLLTITIPEKNVVPTANATDVPVVPPATAKETAEAANASKKVDIRGTIKIVLGVPGLFALIFFTTFNNFLGGAFMALMDPYGLSLVPVQVWGLLWGFLSAGFIIGGLVIAKRGLGKNPLRSLFIVNIILWTVTILFPIQASIILLTIGMFIYMLLVPAVEAAEQTILQKVVPYERQGRVFGFAQSIEQAASPLTAFMIGPIAQFIFIPFMTAGAGVELIGGWFGTGDNRGMALIFILTGSIGLIATLLAFGSKYYRQLSAHYLKSEQTS